MSTNNDGWILMSERKPTQADMPVWLNDGPDDLVHLYHGPIPTEWISRYWKPAAEDIPAPPRELTQHDKDDEGYDEWWTTKGANMSGGFRDAWHAALAYERAEVLRLIGNERELRKRCGGEL